MIWVRILREMFEILFPVGYLMAKCGYIPVFGEWEQVNLREMGIEGKFIRRIK